MINRLGMFAKKMMGGGLQNVKPEVAEPVPPTGGVKPVPPQALPAPTAVAETPDQSIKAGPVAPMAPYRRPIRRAY